MPINNVAYSRPARGETKGIYPLTTGTAQGIVRVNEIHYQRFTKRFSQ